MCKTLDRTRGLTSEEAAIQRQLYGDNHILTAAPGRWLDILVNTARDPMIWFLLGVGFLFALLGEWTEATVLFFALIPLLAMDSYLHRKTQASTASLASRLASFADVLRDGAVSTIEATALVPSDIVLVSAGSYIPADGLVVSCDDAQVDESTLTGEAFPVRKSPIPSDTDIPKWVRTDQWVFAGTRLLTGRATLLVMSTGAMTVYGEIARMANQEQRAMTPLQMAVRKTVQLLVLAAIVLCALLAVMRLFNGHGFVDALLSAVMLAIAALPEEFPIVLTFFLGVGVYRLARRQALVRKAVVVESIGRVSCICFDKTGTLTEGQLRLGHADPDTDWTADDLLRHAAMACSRDSDDPVDTAILAASRRPLDAFRELAVFPFTETRKREVHVLDRGDGEAVAVMKGAPEEVLGRCRLSADATRTWEDRTEKLATSGHKVIAVATQAGVTRREDAALEPETGYRFLGLLAFEDPLRGGVREAVAECLNAGIHLVMVTGDHPLTARAMALEAGIGTAQTPIFTGDELDAILDDPGQERLMRAHVIARATPFQKRRLVERLKEAGHIVAVTGDGVNDVPALNAADIGIAMGRRGTQSAREVASIVLLDDSFETIVRAIAEGRQLFRNLRLAFTYLVMVHIPFVLSAAFVPLLDSPLLYMPVHIVWLELIIHPTALLVFQELPEDGPLKKNYETGGSQILSGRGWALVALPGILLGVLITLSFWRQTQSLGSVEHARAVALGMLIVSNLFMTAALGQMMRPMTRTILAAVLVSLIVLVQVPFLAALLDLRPLRAVDWLGIAAVGAIMGLAARWVRTRVVENRD